MIKDALYTCEQCGKELFSMKEYNEETTDVSYGFEWVIEHKKEFCKNTDF